MSHGAEIVEESVDGTLSYGEFYQQMALKHALEGTINKITFLDPQNQEGTREEAFASDLKINNSGSSSGKKKATYVIAPMLNSPLQRTLWDTSSENSIKSSSSAAVKSTTELGRSEKRAGQAAQSVWSAAIFGAQKAGKSANIVKCF